MKRWIIRIAVVFVFVGFLAGAAILGWLTHGWRNPVPPAAPKDMTEPLIDDTLLKCKSAIIVVGPRDLAAESDQGWNQALSLVAANELADELRTRGFQRALTSFNVTCKPVTQVRVVTLDERDKLDAEVSKSAATIIFYISLHSVEATKNTKTTLAYSYKGSGDLFLPKHPDGKFHWTMDGSSETTDFDNDLAEVKDVPMAMVGRWARLHYLGDEFSMGKSFLGLLGN